MYKILSYMLKIKIDKVLELSEYIEGTDNKYKNKYMYKLIC